MSGKSFCFSVCQSPLFALATQNSKWLSNQEKCNEICDTIHLLKLHVVDHGVWMLLRVALLLQSVISSRLTSVLGLLLHARAHLHHLKDDAEAHHRYHHCCKSRHGNFLRKNTDSHWLGIVLTSSSS